MHLAVATLMGAGDHIVSSRSLYGGTHNLLEYTLKRFGIDTTFVDSRDIQAFTDAIQPNTKLIFGEVLGNPGLEVLNIPQLADVAHAHDLPLMVDSTFATPYLCKPIEMGADLVMHSATKFLSGHGVVIGGVLVDGGTFDWQASGKFPTLSEPYEGFHDLVFAQEFGPLAFITRARKEGIRDFGACMAPMTAFQILQGIETLPLRMDRHVANTLQVVEFLAEHALVEEVVYPGMAAHADYELAKQLLPKGAGAVFTFTLKGGREAGRTFIEALELFSHLANIGDAKSLVIHPASTTHHRMDQAALQAAGVSPGMVRVSVGLEDVADLIADLKTGLRAVGR
jgi:O-acetylhomoserine (thiol)-lyase